VPLGPLAVDLSGTGRLGDVIQAGGTAPPAVRAAFGEPLLSEHPQRDETAEGDSRAARAASAPRASAWSSTCSPAIKTVHAVPATPDASPRYVVFIYSNGTARAECFNGNSDSIPAPAYVANNCTTIVRIYQNRNENGPSALPESDDRDEFP
jgi:hypothetical protein